MTLPRRCCPPIAIRVRRGAALALCLAAWGPAWAGRPLNTDDAAILPAGACQLQAWLRPSRHLDELVLQPACHPWGGVEWDASLAMARAAGGASSTSLGLQAKDRVPDGRAGESYGERHEAGAPARSAQRLRPQRLQLDATLGHEPFDGRGEAFATIGLVWFWEHVEPPRSAR